MKQLRLFFFCALILYSAHGNSQAKQLIYIRVQESFGPIGFDSYMHITYPDQTTKYIELVKVGIGGKGADDNGKVIQREISRLLNQGYEILSSSTGSGDNSTTTTLFLSRKEPE